MGRKTKKASGLGRQLIRDRKKKMKKPTDTWLHTSDLNDGSGSSKNAMKSVTEESSLNEFLSTAQLAGTEFTAEKLNLRVVTETHNSGLPTAEEARAIATAQEENRAFLKIPRRPVWDESTTPEQLDERERDSFLLWRRQLAELQENEHLILTPFEKNLDFWRQLWRVIERSDVIVQIVDARNPLLFHCQDLERYVKEVDTKKENLLLLNKSDLLTDTQRAVWFKYFRDCGVRVVFWSATEEQKRLNPSKSLSIGGTSSNNNSSEGSPSNSESEESLSDEDSADELLQTDRLAHKDEVSTKDCDAENDRETEYTSVESQLEEVSSSCVGDEVSDEIGASLSDKMESLLTDSDVMEGSKLLTCDQLLDVFQSLGMQSIVDVETDERGGKVTTIGLVGYPNVGKSSTINTLLQDKKVPVSVTPGRTKHFQTLFVDKSLCLCDCPGLVFPKFVSTKAEMVCNGILPIDQMRDYIGPISQVCQTIPRHVLERTYGIYIVCPADGEDPNRPPHSFELLNAYGYMRGFMTVHGQPDCPRGARYILKDYVNGKLLYCKPPPSVQVETFNKEQFQVKQTDTGEVGNGVREERHVTPQRPRYVNEVDQSFFSQDSVQAISKGIHGTRGFTRKSDFVHHHSLTTKPPDDPSSDTATVASVGTSVTSKPWKKHHKKHKKEKTRRLTDTKTNSYLNY